jgi:hypothetical protein
MIHVIERVRLEASIDLAWRRLTDVEWLLSANVFHQRVCFQTYERRGAGTRAIVDHGLPLGPRVPRLVRISHWDEGVRIRWTDVDPKYPIHRFPHAEEIRLTSLDDGATLLSDELTGTLNLQPPRLGTLPDRAFTSVVRWAVRRQCRYFSATIRRASSAPGKDQPWREAAPDQGN